MFSSATISCIAVSRRFLEPSSTSEAEAVMVTDGAASLSLVITGTVLSDRAVYLESLVLLLLIAKITSLSIVPSRIGSSIPDTVTV